MPTPFAALESRAVAAVNARLANATANIDGVDVDGIFRDEYAEGFGGAVGGQAPVFDCLVAALPDGVARGSEVVIGDVDYVVAEPQPDGCGGITLRLRLK